MVRIHDSDGFRGLDLIFDIETSGLNHKEHRITCITVMHKDISKPLSFCDQDEFIILQNFWAYVNKIKPDRFIGFNNFMFDNKFLFWRTVFLDIDSGFPLLDFGKSIDLRPILGIYQKRFYGAQKYEKGKLEDYCGLFGISTSPHSGAECVRFFEQNEFGLIQEHCEGDVSATWELYMKVRWFI